MDPTEACARTRVKYQPAALQLRDRLPGGTSNQRSNPGKHLLDSERLNDIIIGAAVNPFNLLVPAVSRRQNQNGPRESRSAPPSQKCQPIDLRQTKVKHNSIIGFRVSEEIGALAVVSAVHRVTRVAKAGREILREALFIFNDQNPQSDMVIYHS